MAQKVQFLGFKRVLADDLTMQNNYLYFVRESVSDNEGKLWFNGVCYGSCRDSEIDDINTALAGFLSGGTVTDVKEYIDSLIGGKDASVTGTSSDNHVTVQVDETDGALTSVVVTTSDIASATALTAEETARENADTALQTEIDAIETAVGLSSGGTYVAGDGQFTSAATSVADAIDKLDDALASAVTDIETEIETKINALDANESGASTYVNVRVQEENGVITEVSVDDSALEAAIEAMDLAEVHEAGKAIVAVSEADGVVSATAGTVAAQYVDVADAGGLFTATNVEGALAELYSGYVAGDEALLGDASESGNTLGKLEDRIEALDADAKEYHLVKVTTGLAADIKEEYYLADAEGNQSGDTISIPKDSHIVEINYITDSGDPHYQNLEYVYIDVCGATKTEYVDMSQLVLEQEFASGVQITNHVAHGVVDPQSEEFLTVGADGFKLSGVQDAIDDAKTAATAYTQSEIQKLDVTGDTAVAGQYVAAIEETDGVVAVKTRANVSEAVLNNYAKGSDATAVAATDTVNEAISKLENQVDAAKAAATTKVEKDASANHLTLTSSTASDGSVTYTIGEDDIASASALTQEISDREDADAAIQAELNAVESSLGFTDTAYTNSGTYICGNTVTDDIKRLDTALGDLNDNMADLADALEATAATLTDMIEEEAQERAEAIENEASARTAADEALEDKLEATAQTLFDAIEEEAALRESGDTALDARLDVVESSYITAVTVNGVNATVAGNAADVDIQADDIELGEAVTGTTGGVSFDASANTQDVFQRIVDVLNQSVAGSYTGVTSNDGSISLTPQTNGQDLSVNTKTLQLADVQAGETEVKKDESTGALYGVMYWIDEETA